MVFYYPLQDYFLNEGPGLHWDNKHNSLDFAIPEGTKLYAVQSGVVVEARNTPNYSTGKMVALKVQLQNYGEVFFTYMHMSEVYVKNGDTVQIGQVIGLSGNTGNSTGPHLHLQSCKGIWYNVSEDIPASREDGEEYREEPRANMTLTEKLFKYLKVKKGAMGGTVVPASPLQPVPKMAEYYTKNFDPNAIGFTGDIPSRIAQLAVHELGLGLNKEQNLMNVGVYAKLMRSMYMKYSKEGDSIFEILKNYGGFSGWYSRGYPTLEECGTDLSYLEPVKLNILNGATYGLSGKYLQIARCYPLQNYGYGAWYPQSRSIEQELETRILNQDIVSHITINSGPTCLIGAIGNTGFFTTCDVVSNLGNFPENQLLINSANIQGG